VHRAVIIISLIYAVFIKKYATSYQLEKCGQTGWFKNPVNIRLQEVAEAEEGDLDDEDDAGLDVVAEEGTIAAGGADDTEEGIDTESGSGVSKKTNSAHKILISRAQCSLL